MIWLSCVVSFLVGVIVTFRLMWVVIVEPLIGITGTLVEESTCIMRTNIEQRKIISDYVEVG